MTPYMGQPQDHTDYHYLCLCYALQNFNFVEFQLAY